MFGFAFKPNIATVQVRNFFTNRKPDARSGKISFGMKPLKYLEDFFFKLLLNTNAVIAYNKYPFVFVVFYIHQHQRLSVPYKLDGVVN